MPKFFLFLFLVVLLEGNSLEKESAQSNTVLSYSFMEMAHQTQRKSYLRIYARNVITLFIGIIYI